jgi:beta-glucuronidase
VNGEAAGEHSGGYLPFQCDITPYVKEGQSNTLVIRVNNELSHDTIPQGATIEDHIASGKNRNLTYPPTVFDFLSYGGIHRPVKIACLPHTHLDGVKIDTELKGKAGLVKYTAELSGDRRDLQVTVTLRDGGACVATQTQSLTNSVVTGELAVSDCRLWGPDDPHLYQCHFEVFDGETLWDEYSLDIGLRDVRVEGDKLLLNGEPVFLKGFGKHEDFPVIGKALSHPLIVKDCQLMKWIGANSFRTSHYPYAEAIIKMADRMGFLVIDEAPAVSMNLRHATPKTLEAHKQALTELIARDYNHPSVIGWSVANEPGIWGEEEAVGDVAAKYWGETFDHVRALDPKRPITLPACLETGFEDPSFELCDFISLNRYWGWYDLPGDLDSAGRQFKEELQTFYDRFQKPILVSEFGADTMEGEHATYPQMFTEEYQTDLIMKYFEVIESLPFMVGEHIWNFADFRTAQHHRRVVLNKKGVFTRQRDPKSCAFAIRKHWTTT